MTYDRLAFLIFRNAANRYGCLWHRHQSARAFKEWITR
jgi:hypothetical protein